MKIWYIALSVIFLCKSKWQIDVTVAGLAGKEIVKCSRLVSIFPDTSLEAQVNSLYDAVILPGGLKGTELLSEAQLVGQILKHHEKEGKIVAAICAGNFNKLEQ